MYVLKRYFYFITISPLLPSLVCFIAGILWQSYNLSYFLACAAFILLTISYCFYTQLQWKQATWSIIYFAVASLGSFFYQKEFNDYHAFYQFTNNSPITVVGTIEDINKAVVAGKQTIIISLNTHSIENETSLKKIDKTMLFYSPYRSDIQVGNTIQIFNIICKKPDNLHLCMYQMREQIRATVFTPHLNYTVIDNPSWSFKRWVYEKKQAILQSCEQQLSPQSFLFFSSLFLGNRLYVKNKLEDINEQFKHWGIFHFLARSGLHLALFVIMWQAIFRYIPIPLILKTITIIALSIIYALFSWSSIPFTRSLLLFLFNKSCLITKVSYNLLHYLTLTCFCFLLYCPLYLFFLDFQLTFGITFTLAWFNILSDRYNTLH